MASKGTRTTAVVLGWVLTAAVATAVGIAAVTAIGSGLADSTSAPLSQSDVAASLAHPQPPAPPESSSPSAQPPPSAAAENKVLATPGGSVVASCSAGKARLLSWSPNQGYQTDDVDRGPDKTAKIKFDSDEQELTVKVDCPGGRPTAHTTADEDD